MRPVNLLPERKRFGDRVRNRVVVFAAGMPVFLLANLIAWLVGSALLSADLASGHAEIASIRQKIEHLGAERGTLNQQLILLRGERSAREAIAARPVWATLLLRIASVSASQGRLDRITVRPFSADRARAATGTGPVRVGFEITLVGQASDANALTRMLLDLEEIGVFDQVSLVSSARVREDNSDPSVRFEIRCGIVGGES